MPVAWDQLSNGRELERLGIGKNLPFGQVTEEKFRDAINEVLSNPAYAKAAKMKGDLILDQKESPMERTIWWLEFLLRHPEQNYFRSPLHDLAWYTRCSLDVVAFLSALIIIPIYVLIKVLSSLCCRPRKTDKKKKRE